MSKPKMKWWHNYKQHQGVPMTPQEIAEACEDAADTLEGHWVQGDWYIAETGAYCLEGGLAAVLGMDVTMLRGDEHDERALLKSCPVYNAVVETITLRGPGDEFDGELPSWNDRDSRTEAQVLDLLRFTAKRVLYPDLLGDTLS